MKTKIILITILVLFLSVFFFCFLPLYSSAKKITELKSKFNLVAMTKSYAEIAFKVPLFTGAGGIIPLNTKIKVSSTPLYLDMSDRSLIRFEPESEFSVIPDSEKNYTVNLIKGKFYFFRNHDGKFLFVKSKKGTIELKGTSGAISDDEIEIASGLVTLLNGNIDIKANQELIGNEIRSLDPQTLEVLTKNLIDLKESDQKDIWANIFDHLPNFQSTVDQNSLKEFDSKIIASSQPKETMTGTVEESKETDTDYSKFALDFLLKKTKVYYDMYTLRMAITNDRYFDNAMSFPNSIESLNDDVASKLTNDPWGTHYLYTINGTDYFNLRSAGPDKSMNTKDDIILFRTDGGDNIWQL